MKKLSFLPALFFLVSLGIVGVYSDELKELGYAATSDGAGAYVTFVLVLAVATVFVPLTAMPLIPMVAMMFGPFETALLSIVGWTLGAVAAFCVSRYLGRPAVQYFFSLKELDAFIADLSQRHRFLMIVLIRLVTPVDIASYALGLSKSIGIVEYTLATAVGVSWFSFAFAYLGVGLLEGDYRLLLAFGVPSLLIFIAGWYMLRQKKANK